MNRDLLTIYTRLLDSFGPQGWWPLTPHGFTSPIHHPSNTSKQLTQQDRTEIILGAILTQNTSWKNAEKALTQLHEAGLVDFAKLSCARHETIARAIRSAGYYNQKAKRLKTLARHLMRTYHGNLGLLNAKQLPALRAELLSLHGIGPETADSIVLYAFGKPSFVVDAYTRRILERLSILKGEEPYNTIQHLFHSTLTHDPVLFKEYHAVLVELAKQHCRTTPICSGCPLVRHCKTGLNAPAQSRKNPPPSFAY